MLFIIILNYKHKVNAIILDILLKIQNLSSQKRIKIYTQIFVL